VEHWEEESHDLASGETEHSHQTLNLTSAHDDIGHINEMNFYLALFSVFRLLVIGVYLYYETRNLPVNDYMQDNWFNWPNPANKSALKAKIKQC
jgi:hypothetical protein